MALRNTEIDIEVEGYVWCDKHGCVHEDSTDPYGTGTADCWRVDHRTLYMVASPDEIKTETGSSR